ncbi:nacht and tpr domain protein [Diplodia corticola]|uniref:Nacht and tpr domain protein n=1 Tax=Diplodia corticola TaxID=236234 RepID=A0A1J9QLU4_9PEZI|nr:nacht and tpr domain protein [Diplodia corticola]OJD29034.1 nacht and tpr domain protein [Diplodia corticola]
MDPGLGNAQAVQNDFDDAVNEYIRQTGDDIRAKKPLSKEEMRREMAKISTGSADHSLRMALDFLMKVGELAIGTASNAWPPAALCFQALQSLVDAKDHYQRYFSVKSVRGSLDQILTVLQDVSKYLEGTNLGAQIDDELHDLLRQRLAYFLRMCAIYTTVQKNSKRARGIVKNLYMTVAGRDGGITETLDTLRSLEDREKKYLARDTWTITRAFWDLQAKDTFQQRKLHAIMAGLGLSEKDPVWNSSLERHIKLRQNFLGNSGAWLLDSKRFSDWMKPETTKHVFLLQAEPGNGKTYLCSEVVAELERRRKERRGESNPSCRSVTAYFYFEEGRKSSASRGKEERETPIRDAFAAILWQLANLDPVYQNFVHSECTNSQSKPATGIELWDKFVTTFSNRARNEGRRIFYIVLDGISINHSKSSELIGILKRATQLRGKHIEARFFLSGTEHALENIGQTLNESTDVIKVSDHITADIHAFIGSRMKELFNKGSKEETEILKKLEEKLRQDYSGGYQQAESALDDIKNAIGSMSELQRILDREPGINLEWHIKRLTSILSKEEIEEVNDIVICIALLTVWPSLKQLETFLKLREGLDHDQVKSIEFSGLQERLQERYSQLFHLEDDEDQIVKSKDTMDFFLERERSLKDGAARLAGLQSGNDRTTQNQLHESEIATVEKIINSVCGDEVFKRFHFDDFFKKLRDPRNSLSATIQFNSTEGHIEIIYRTLKAACDEARERYRSLHEYAAMDLMDHLGHVTPPQLATTSPTKTKSIMDNLVAFFKDKDVIRAWLNPFSIQRIPFHARLGDFDSIDNALLLLNEPSLMPKDLSKSSGTPGKEIDTPTEGEQGSDVVEDSSTSLKYTKAGLLKTPTEVLATMWLLEETHDVRDVFCCFGAFCTAFFPESGKSFYRDIYLDNDAETVSTLEKYAARVLNVTDIDQHLKDHPTSLWNLRVAETYLACGHAEEAITRCKAGDPTSWQIIWCTARAHRHQGEVNQAIKVLDQNCDKIKDPTWRKAHASAWSSMVSQLLYWYDYAGKTEKAITFSRILWNIYKNDLEVQKLALQRVDPASKNIEALRSFLKAYDAPVDLFHHCADDSRFHDNVLLALQNDFGGINKHYLDAIDALKKTDMKINGTRTTERLAWLRFYYGMALFHLDRRREAQIVWEDNTSEIRENLQSEPGEQQSLVQIYARNTEKLAECYIQMMKKSEIGTNQAYAFAFKIDGSMGGDYPSSAQSHRLTFALARIYSFSGIDFLARESLKGEVRSAFQILTDDVDENDWEGYWRLCQVFVALSDHDNARVAWSLITQETLYEAEFCRGDCKRLWSDWGEKDLHICMDCADVRLSSCCLRKLQDGLLEKRICGKDHSFMSFEKLDTARAKKFVEKGVVPGSDRQILDWQNEVRRLFGLEERTDGTADPSRLRKFARRLVPW